MTSRRSCFWGSSPHTRGAREGFRERGEDPGIIPAYAGSTGINEEAPPARRDHPRIRGEHAFRVLGDGQRVGSSPHTRGAPGDFEDGPVGDRIIPAYAGSTRTN